MKQLLRHPLVLFVGIGVVVLDAQNDVVLGPGPVRALVSRDVRHAEQERAQLFLRPLRLGLDLGFLLAEGPALLLLGFGGGLVAAAIRLAHLLGEDVDPVAELVSLARRIPLPAVELGRLVEHRRVDTAPGDAGFERVELGAQAPGVQHEGDGSVPDRARDRGP